MEKLGFDILFFISREYNENHPIENQPSALVGLHGLNRALLFILCLMFSPFYILLHHVM